MPRAPATLDSFSAVAEPRRRRLLAALAVGGGELPVNAIVDALNWPQPQVSKHLGVLRHAGLVSVRRRGRERVYRVNGDGVKPIHDWAVMFERYWSGHLDRIRRRAEAEAARSRRAPPRT